VCIRLDAAAADAAVKGELWSRLRDRYLEETGFDLERD